MSDNVRPNVSSIIRPQDCGGCGFCSRCKRIINMAKGMQILEDLLSQVKEGSVNAGTVQQAQAVCQAHKNESGG